jgi:hypothetical protein
MHPVIMQQLAADHIRELITEAEDAQRSRRARRIQRGGQPARLGRSTGLYARQRQSRLSPGPSSPPGPRHGRDRVPRHHPSGGQPAGPGHHARIGDPA